MKKISSITQLRAERKRLEKRRVELEAEIGNAWSGFRQQFSPRYQASHFFSRVFEKKNGCAHDEDFLADTISQMAAGFARKVTEEAEEKIRRWWRKTR